MGFAFAATIYLFELLRGLVRFVFSLILRAIGLLSLLFTNPVLFVEEFLRLCSGLMSIAAAVGVFAGIVAAIETDGSLSERLSAFGHLALILVLPFFAGAVLLQFPVEVLEKRRIGKEER